MTREELFNDLIDDYQGKDRYLRDIVNDIFDSFESRTCGSCKLYDSTGKCMLSKQDGDVWTFINVEPDFGCNKWIAKDDK